MAPLGCFSGLGILENQQNENTLRSLIPVSLDCLSGPCYSEPIFMAEFTEIIRKEVARRNYRFSYHARINKASRRIRVKEVVETILKGQVIEENPKARPSPKCLFMHPVRSGEPLYVVCAHHGKTVKIITVHWRDPNKWIGWRTRRKN